MSYTLVIGYCLQSFISVIFFLKLDSVKRDLTFFLKLDRASRYQCLSRVDRFSTDTCHKYALLLKRWTSVTFPPKGSLFLVVISVFVISSPTNAGKCSEKVVLLKMNMNFGYRLVPRSRKLPFLKLGVL